MTCGLSVPGRRGQRSIDGSIPDRLATAELELCVGWPSDRGDDVAFATKPQLARTMVARAVELGLPLAWVTAVGAMS